MPWQLVDCLAQLLASVECICDGLKRICEEVVVQLLCLRFLALAPPFSIFVVPVASGPVSELIGWSSPSCSYRLPRSLGFVSRLRLISAFSTLWPTLTLDFPPLAAPGSASSPLSRSMVSYWLFCMCGWRSVVPRLESYYGSRIVLTGLPDAAKELPGARF